MIRHSTRNKLPTRAAVTNSSSIAAMPMALGISPETRRINRVGERAVQNDALKKLLQLRAANGGKKFHGDIKMVIDDYQSKGFSQVTRSNLEYRLQLYKQNNPPTAISIPEVQSDISPITGADTENDKENDVSQTVKRKSAGGRTKGTTNEAKLQNLLNIKKAINEASELYLKAKNDALSDGKKKTRNGTLDMILRKVEQDNDVTPGTIYRETIISRVQANNVTGVALQRISSLHVLDDTIMDTICRLARMNAPLTKAGIKELVDDMIRGTQLELDFRKFCLARGVEKEEGKAIVGESWYQSFMKRHDDQLKRGKVKIRDQQRSSWCTYENFECMYHNVYEAMVSCGVAVKDNEDKVYNKEGIEVFDPKEMYGKPTKYRMTKPERCIFVDETGCNTNQTDDTQNDFFVFPKDMNGCARNGATTDLHFTVVPFIAGTGEAVLCAVILKSDKEVKDMPLTWRIGIDMTREPEDGKTRVEIYQNNCKEGQCMSGGPVCRFNGKDLPCFVGCSPNASITTELLIEMLKVMDGNNVFSRNGPNDTPFLLLDGHHSRTKLEFLLYINNPGSKWTTCIGVPYGTHIWQPADSSELNGSFKYHLNKTKTEYLDAKLACRNIKSFAQTDVIPILRKAWQKSIGKQQQARKAIVERGWGILNYVLLLDERLKKMMVNTTPDQQSTIESSTTALSHSTNSTSININRTGSFYQSCLDKLIEEEAKAVGRKRKWEEEQKRIEGITSRFDRLREFKTVRSGNFAAMGQYELNEIVLAVVQEHEDKKDDENKTKSVRVAKTVDNCNKKFKVAGNKFKTKQTLTVGDMRSLMKKIPKVAGDSPLKLRLDDVNRQYRRRLHRINLYFDPLYEQHEDSKIAAEPEIMISNNLEEVNIGRDESAMRTLVDVAISTYNNSTSSNTTSTITSTGIEVVEL